MLAKTPLPSVVRESDGTRANTVRLWALMLTVPALFALASPAASSPAGIAPVVVQSGTAVVGRAKPGNLHGAYAINTTATAGYLICINAAAVPASGTAITPIDVQTLAGAVGATASINYGAGPPNAYSTGITCLVTTSLTTYTAGGASFIQARVSEPSAPLPLSTGGRRDAR